MRSGLISGNAELPELFLQLAEKDRNAILVTAAQELGKSAQVLEKDVWVCWTLEKLAAMPGVPPFAFKGGTSLSKAYNAIARFSEDVDVTLDRESIAPEQNPFTAKNNSQRKKIRKALNKSLITCMESDMKPYFDDCIRTEVPDEASETEIVEDKTQLLIRYPSCIGDAGIHMQEHVILEFGCRNKITPAENKKLVPYVKSVIASVKYPEPTVSVLAPERTFWEKATLIHVECNNPDPKERVNKYSRHWYDLAQLAKGDIGESALADLELLEDVVHQNNVLFQHKHANYDQCLSGNFRLIPDERLKNALVKDFDEMVADQFFWEDPGTFDDILSQLADLEAMVNKNFPS